MQVECAPAPIDVRGRYGWILAELSQPATIVTFALAAFYCLMFQKYRAYDLDNPWFLSFSYNLTTTGVEKDVFWYVPFPDGMDGTIYFGKLAAYVLSAPLAVVGWQARLASLVVIAFTVASLVLWRYALRSWGISERFTAFYILLLGLTEPVLSMAQKFRYEFFAFFLFSLAIWLASQKRAFLALLLAFLAVETEPAAIVCPAAIFLLLRSDLTSIRKLLPLTACAGALAFGVYELMHPHAIPLMFASAKGQQAAGYLPGSTLTDYFLVRRRHLLDLAFLLLGVWLWRRNGSDDRFQVTLGTIALLLSACFFLSPHPNVSYMVFLMPFLLLLALHGYLETPRLHWTPVVFMSLLLAQYAALYYVNYREGFSG
jgi:hypothetical protein